MQGDYNRFNDTAELLKVLAHPVRICIIRGLIEKGSCNVNNMKECMELPQSTVSQHLQKLRSAGIIEGERHGLEVIYRIVDKRVIELIKILVD